MTATIGARRRRRNLRSHRRSAFRFFHRSAGYCVGRRALGAWHLTKAEEWLQRLCEADQARIVWDWDDGADLSWMTDTERAKEHEILCARIEFRCVSCRGWETVASLCGIVDADADYRRVIEAELACEAMHDTGKRLRP